jgi:hypothetical protein
MARIVMRESRMRPPTTPPIIAPSGAFLGCEGEGEGVVVLVEFGVVVVLASV